MLFVWNNSCSPVCWGWYWVERGCCPGFEAGSSGSSTLRPSCWCCKLRIGIWSNSFWMKVFEAHSSWSTLRRSCWCCPTKSAICNLIKHFGWTFWCCPTKKESIMTPCDSLRKKMLCCCTCLLSECLGEHHFVRWGVGRRWGWSHLENWWSWW